MRDKTYIILVASTMLFFCAGCASYTLHERKKGEAKNYDQGTKTEVKLMGPRAKVVHGF